MQETKVLLLKYGEIALKGLNRSNFEKLLEQNIINAIRNYKNLGNKKNLYFNIEREQSIMTVSCEDINFDIDNLIPVLSKVFGIVTINSAVKTEKNIEKIKEIALKYIAPVLENKKSFGVLAKRSDKSFAIKSPEIALQVGDVLFENNKNIKVDLKNPEVWVAVEIRNNGAFIHASNVKYKGAGGMPTGSNGAGLLLLSGGIDSPVAGYMMARRGMKISVLHFTSEPYTSERAKEKVLRLSKILSQYCGDIKFYAVSLTEIQESIRQYCAEDYTTVLLRRFMIKIAGEIAKSNYLDCVITGESLGQVASQTIQAIKVIYDNINIPVFRPCIGLDKSQIIETAEKIGTYETSVEPYEDCCSIFTPRHPVTKPKLESVLTEENRIADAADLIERAISNSNIDKDNVNL
ncbi:MAG: tRNA 4-thiouridine(8) synthase ThiI [Oscillospiraceae bacterium]|nr:tRNA 4-thiouridine(8) synthase ThiI [Oscillospiraceae bacterium]